MGINQVQFQKGLSMAQFLERYGTEEKCHAGAVALSWPNGFVCSACGETRHRTFVRKGLTYWQCSACREQTTVLCGTIFEATKLPLTTWFLAMHLLTQAKNNISALDLKRHLGVRHKTAWLLKHKLMQVMSEREASRQLDGRVEIDDAYLGGELPRRQEWEGFAEQGDLHCGRANLWCFQAVPASGAPQERIVTGGGAASVRMERFRAVNTFPGNLKTAYSGTYHAFDFAEYAHRYLAEVQDRFNRRFDLSSILRRLLVAAVATAPWPERFLRRAEHCG